MFRPWGNYSFFIGGKTWQVKRLEIKPDSSLSLQLHNHRAEYWIAFDGTAKVQIGKEVTVLNVNDSIYVPKGAKHRSSNPGLKKL
tara:strand:- start:107 stop:361 length:255 start_codon:yes stop_codon:yes gene_type:complete